VRIVSLVPSITETLLAWGLEPVAVTRFCEQPTLRAVGGTKDPDLDAIVAIAPDLVVMDDEENRREDADALAAAGLTLHVTHVRTLADVESTLTALAAAVDPVRRFDASEVRHLRAKAGERAPAGPRRRAFVPIWRRPWMTLSADTYGSSLLAWVGIDNVFAGATDRYPTVTLDEAAARQPDLVLAPTEPYPFKERHLDELRSVAADVRLVDGQDLFWWGARTPAALDRLAAALTAR
jgi:ABC-type Fe3+-hydroxamate transport system substrate-binding protein